MAISRIVKAINELESAADLTTQAIKSSQISSQGTIDSPGNATVTITSDVVIPGNGPRLVIMANLSLTKDVHFAIDMDAEDGKGIVVFPRASMIIPLGDSRGLHAIVGAATAEISWQSFG